MTTETLIVAGVIVLLVVLTFIGLLSRYRKCASDEILVVFGKAGKKKVVNEKTGKPEEVILPSKIIHGGGTFVMPVIQDWAKMSLKPIQIQVNVTGVSSQMIKVTIPVTLTTGIGTTQTLMQNAASRFLTAKTSEISDQIKDILIGEVRSLMATMTIEEINADRIKFIGKAKENIETELNKVGFSIININNADISDDANYIKNLGQKAATKALAQAQADIAEEKKKGDIQIAETNKQREIAVADAEKERETTVAQTRQEQEVRVAEINQEKEIKLAEAEKNKQSGIANQKAANIAKANTAAESEKAKAEAEKISAIAKAQAEADSNRAESESLAEANVAKAKADSKKAEAEKQTRIAQAKQKQEAETQKAINEQEAAVAKYESDKRVKAAEADKIAGVAEQNATIEVSKAKGEAEKAKAEAEKVAGTSKVEAQMTIEKTKQEKQLEVNEAAALAMEAKLHAETIVPAQKEKERITIEAEAVKQKAVLEAEAKAAEILKEAEANATKLQLEAEGTRKKLLAEAEGKRASLMAEADKVQAIEMAPALAVQKMIESGLTPEMVVQYKTVDQLTGIAEASAQMFEHVHLGQVTVYGNENTAGNFMAKTAENLNPAFDLLRSIPFADTLKSVLGKKGLEEKKVETTEFEEVK